MKILVFIDWYYPGFKAGGPIQSVRNLITTLGNRHSFFIITSTKDLHDTTAYEGIPEQTWIKGPAGEQIFYIDPGQLNAAVLKREFNNIQPDRIYLNSLFSLRYSWLPILFLRTKLASGHTLLAPRGMLHPGALGLKAAKKKLFLFLFRLLKFDTALLFHATTSEEYEIIKNHFPNARVRIAGNIPRFPKEKPNLVNKTPGFLKLIMVGRIHPTKNLLYLLHRLMELNANDNVELSIIGPEDDPAYLQECLDFAKQLPGSIQLRFGGALPPDTVEAELRNAHMLVLPTLGENFGHAIFEALAFGKPVLISDKTPWQNLEEQQAGWTVPLNDPVTFTQVLKKCTAMNQEEYMIWSEAAYRFAHNYFMNASYIESYEALFQ